MAQCHSSEEKPHLTLLYYLSVALGLVLILSLNLFFAFRWHTKLTKSYRRKKMPMLSAMAVTFMSYDRCARLLGVYLSYNASGLITTLWYHITNSVSVVGIYTSIMLLLCVKLHSTFQNSAYQLEGKEVKALYTITLSNLFCVYLFFMLNGIPFVYNHEIGQVTLMVLALITLIVSLIIIFKVDIGFANRIRGLVASSTSTSFMLRSRSLSNSIEASVSGDNSPNNPPDFTSKYSDTVHTNSNRPCLQNYNSNQRFLLQTAAKSMVSALWISAALFVIFSSSIMFIFGHCGNVSNVAGHLGLAVAYPIIALSISLSLPHSVSEYDLCCRICDRTLLNALAFQTTQTIMKRLSTADEIDTTATATPITATPTTATPTTATPTVSNYANHHQDTPVSTV